ncbi:peptidoglycan editing factor PgeF [Idiomarina sp. UBA3162]|uniref:peptidoglycan editing factor PgeF n=1 Tax=Idiomarina sp. UBA3162 TaxID=1946641 RepID=UPI000C945552|nr:peptidoglycan editing factor PgeF [Idiomarina sp. UBA3162]MAD53750.1 hypothetical protein [Idiomarinaceae bacterium]
MTLKRILTPDWDLPSGVSAAVTTRAMGNLAAHVGDDPAAVIRRREQLRRQLNVPFYVRWLQQQHTTNVSQLDELTQPSDAVWSAKASICAVLTADCLPLLMCTGDGQKIAAVHAGWRGLAHGVVENTLEAMAVNPANVRVWIGPAISQSAFQVGDEVRTALLNGDASCAAYFADDGEGKWLADLAGIAKQRLLNVGVQDVTLSGWCSFNDAATWYSWRRAQEPARMASLIWRT